MRAQNGMHVEVREQLVGGDSPSFMEVSGIEHRVSGLVAGTFTC